MTLEEIKSAVLAGKKVHWSNEGYEVIKDELDQWFIKCNQNSHCVGLTHQDGVTMNGQPQDFFIAPERVIEPETIYLDLPTTELCDPECHDSEGWVHVKKFTDPTEAVAFIREHIDPYCDDQGRISILSNMPTMPMPKSSLLAALENISQHAFDDDTPIEDIKADFERMRGIALQAVKAYPFPVAPLADSIADCREVRTLVIEVCDGEVQNVQHLPDGWDYEVHDYANDPDDLDDDDDSDDRIAEHERQID